MLKDNSWILIDLTIQKLLCLFRVEILICNDFLMSWFANVTLTLPNKGGSINIFVFIENCQEEWI